MKKGVYRIDKRNRQKADKRGLSAPEGRGRGTVRVRKRKGKLRGTEEKGDGWPGTTEKTKNRPALWREDRSLLRQKGGAYRLRLRKTGRKLSPHPRLT